MWQRLATAYAHLTTSRWGFNLFGRALPSAFFLLGFLGGLDRLPDPALALSDPSPGRLMALAHELISRCLGLCLVVLFAIRKPRIGKAASLQGAIVSLAATFYGAFVIFFNTLGLRPPAPGTSSLLASITLVVDLCAAVLLALSYLWLGRHVGIFPEVRGLVTSGPYRYLRHPIYTAYLLGAAASLLSSLSIEALVIFLTYYALVVWRASLEERALEEVFGDEYRRYCARTLGLWPRLSLPARPA